MSRKGQKRIRKNQKQETEKFLRGYEKEIRRQNPELGRRLFRLGGMFNPLKKEDPNFRYPK